MSDLERYYIPKRLDEPERLLFWSFDEACLMITPIFMGIIVGYMTIGLLLGITLYLQWRKLKGNNQANVIRSLAYWVLPSGIFCLKKTPASHLRLFVG
jgi:conjugal transfer pilus assembly protein TraL